MGLRGLCNDKIEINQKTNLPLSEEAFLRDLVVGFAVHLLQFVAAFRWEPHLVKIYIRKKI